MKDIIGKDERSPYKCGTNKDGKPNSCDSCMYKNNQSILSGGVLPPLSKIYRQFGYCSTSKCLFAKCNSSFHKYECDKCSWTPKEENKMDIIKNVIEELVVKESVNANRKSNLSHSKYEGYAILLEDVEKCEQNLKDVIEHKKDLWINIKADEDNISINNLIKIVENCAINLACVATQIAITCDRWEVDFDESQEVACRVCEVYELNNVYKYCPACGKRINKVVSMNGLRKTE